MAQSKPPPASKQSKGQNEAELARLRKLRGSLPADRKKAGAGMDRRMGELEDSLRTNAGGARTPALRMIGIGLLLLLAVVIGFGGVLTLGHLSGL